MADIQRTAGKPLKTFALVMMGMVAVDSIRTLPITASLGPSLILYYAVAGLGFLMPAALVSAELATAWPRSGGIYVWVSEAFGAPWGFFVAWLQWAYNIIWYPTILALLASTLMYLWDPQATTHSGSLILAMLLLFWLATALTCLGIRASSILSTLGTLLGTIVPIIALSVLALLWLHHGTTHAPAWQQSMSAHHLGMLTTVLFGLMGIEVTGIFAGDVDKPQRDYPRALLIAASLILISLACGSLAIAAVVPAAQLNLASGIMESFHNLLAPMHLSGVMPLAAAAIFLGGLGNLSPWLTGPSRCLMIAAQEGIAPAFLARCNRHGAPVNVLIIQGLLFSVLTCVFMLFPHFNSAYLLLSIMAAQLALLVYIVMFLAVIRLRFTQKNTPRPFRVPGGTFGLWIIPGMAILLCLVALAWGFIPPASFHVHNILRYEGLLLAGIFVGCTLPWLLLQRTPRPPQGT